MQVDKEWDAKAYQQLSEPQFAWGLKVLERIALRGDERALDIGCGTGRLTARLAERLPRGTVLALDQSENMVAEARANLAPTFGERVSFRAQDALALSEVDAVDLVFSTATFHWILDHDRLFTVIHRALAKGGRLVAQCGAQGNLARIRALALELTAKEPFARYFPERPDHWLYAGVEETERRLRAAGFVEIEVDIEDAPTVFDGERVFRAFIERVVLRGFLSKLPTSELREAFLDAAVEDARRTEPPYWLGYRRLNIRATKG